MVDEPDSSKVLLRGQISHKTVHGHPALCAASSKLCKNWSTTLVRSKGKPCSLVFVNREKTCKHILDPGNCLISRPSRRRLIICTISAGVVDESELMLEFASANELEIWEKVLRKVLKVYTFPVCLCEHQIYKEGNYFLHTTKSFIALSQFGNGRHSSVYCENIVTSAIELTLNGEWPAHLEVRTQTGAVDRITFISGKSKEIKDHITMFTQQRKSSFGSSKYTSEDERIVTSDGCILSSPSTGSSGDGYITIDDDDCSSRSSGEGCINKDGDEYPYLPVVSDNERTKRDLPIDKTATSSKRMTQPPPLPLSSHPRFLTASTVTTPLRSDHIYQSLMPRSLPNEYQHLVKRPMRYFFLGPHDSPTECQSDNRYINYRNVCGIEEKNYLTTNVSCRSLTKSEGEHAPPIPPRPRKSQGSRRKVATVWLYLFCSKEMCGGVWILVALLTRCDDEATFKRVRNLEMLCGNEVLTSCRSVVTYGDISIRVTEKSQNFEELCKEEQKVTFGDIDSLSPSTWIVLEFPFKCKTLKVDRFYGSLSVAPSESSMLEESKLTSLTVSVLKEFRSSSLEDSGIVREGSRILMSLKDRIQFCQKMDLDHPMQKDWRWLAGEVGLTHPEAQIVQLRAKESPTEQLLSFMESSNSPYCDLKKLKDVLESMKRFDVTEHLVEGC